MRSNRAGSWTDERYLQVLKQYRDGVRQCDIAKQQGICKQGVRRVLRHAERLESMQASPFRSLSARTRNALFCAGLMTYQSVLAAHEQGFLSGLDGIGAKSVSEISKWLSEASPQ